MKINWNMVIASLIGGIIVAVVSPYIMEAINKVKGA